MAKQKAKTAMPRLRFPEFRNALPWNAKLLKDICAVNPSNDGLPDSFVYIDLESVEDGQLKAKNRIEKSDAPSRAQRHLRNGDVIFQVVRPYQRNNLYVDFDDGQQYVASTGYAQLRAKDSERFLYQAVHVDSFVEGVIAKCTGSNYPAINSSDLAEIQVFVPHDAAEQKKIADCLTSLDEVIAAQGRKVEALKAHKRGLMQQLFPREGETRPRLRFPEFRSAPVWRAKGLNKLAKIRTGRKDANEGAVDGVYPFFTCAENHIYSRSYSFDSEAILIAGNANVGQAKYYNGKFEAYQRTYVLTDFSDVFVPYLYQFLDANLRPTLLAQVQTSAMSYIRLPMLEDFQVALPPSIDEQQRIAECFSSLDTQIAAEAEQLTVLKTHKQGLMQQLFPAPEAVA